LFSPFLHCDSVYIKVSYSIYRHSHGVSAKLRGPEVDDPKATAEQVGRPAFILYFEVRCANPCEEHTTKTWRGNTSSDNKRLMPVVQYGGDIDGMPVYYNNVHKNARQLPGCRALLKHLFARAYCIDNCLMVLVLTVTFFSSLFLPLLSTML
jgi:hypothetical protein